MVRLILRRIGQSVVVLFLVTLMVFLVMHAMPGDPVSLYLGPTATPDQIQLYTKEFGFDQPVLVQYGKWIAGLFHGNMGRSIAFQEDVGPLLAQRVGVTLSVTLPAFLIAVILGVILGVIAAVNHGKAADSVITSVANIGISVPIFWVGILLVYWLSLKMHWLPVQGYTPLSTDFEMGIKKLIMPVFVLALGPMASFTRQTRSAMLEVTQQDYIRTARSKGLKENTVIRGHALRNALIPIITLMGMSIGGLIGGTVLIEQLYVIPGVGSMMMTAIMNKDYMVVQDTVFFIAAVVAVCNLIVDITYGFVDPRIRAEN